MKKNFLKLTSLLVAASMVTSVSAADPVADMMRSGIGDVRKLADLQLTPIGNSFAAGLGGGWYNTARPHKLLGFDLTFSINMATVPDADKSFDFASQKFAALALANGATTAKIPTLLAYDDEFAPDLVVRTAATPVSMPIPLTDASQLANFKAAVSSGAITLPAGASINGNNITYNAPASTLGDPIKMKGLVPKAIPFVAIPTPTVQLGVGLVFGTDLIIRYMPKVGVGDFSAGLWGFGVKHDIKQWIPVVSSIPFFDMTGLFGYTKFNSTYALSVTPDLYGSSNIVNLSNAASWKDQEMEIGASALTFQVIASKGLLLNIFTPYIGLGFTNTNFNINMNGKYPLLKSAISMGKNPVNVNYNSANPSASTVTMNPEFEKLYVDDKIKGTDYEQFGEIASDGKFMPNLTAGLRIKLLILTIHAQYTLQTYSMFSAGVGFAIR